MRRVRPMIALPVLLALSLMPVGCSPTREAATDAQKAVEHTSEASDTTMDGMGDDVRETTQVSLTNRTGHSVVEMALRESGKETWSPVPNLGIDHIDDGTSVTVDLPLSPDKSVHYDLRLTTDGQGTIVLRDVDLHADDITLRFDEGIGYVTQTDASGTTVSTFDDAVSADLADDAPTYDMQSQLD